MTPRDTRPDDTGLHQLPPLEEPVPAAAPQGSQLSATETVRDQPGGISHAWRALRAPNFRLFFSGQSISLIGTWMTRIATSWLVYRLTGSAWLLGMVSFMGQIPTFLLAPFAGVWVDRLNKRKVLVWTQALAAVQSLALAALTLTHRVTIADILALSAFQGLINAFDMPGRQAFMVEMVEDKRDLGNAIALNSSIVNLARLIGPSLAGVVIALYGEGWCFLVDGISYFAVIASLLAMKLRPLQMPPREDTLFQQLQEGWQYVSDFLPIRNLLLLFAIISLMGMPYTVLMPVFASEVLHGGPHTLGFLMAAAGVGALAAAVLLAARKSVKGLLRMVPIVGGALRRRAHRLWAFARPVAVARAHAGSGLRHDAGHGRQQHDHSDACPRRQARPRDELLHYGVCRHGAFRQPACRRPRARYQCFLDCRDYRSVLHPWRGVVLASAEGGSRRHTPDLSRARHYPPCARDKLSCSLLRAERIMSSSLWRTARGVWGARSARTELGLEPKFPKPDPELPPEPELPNPKPLLEPLDPT